MKTLINTSAFIFLFIFASLATAQSCSEEEDEFSTYYHQKKMLFEELENEENEIIFLGDSITDGNEWAEMFDNASIKNRGISGDITLGVLCRMDEVVESNPDKIFIMIGINDLGRGMPVQEILGNYERILEKIEEESPRTTVYIQSLLPVNPDFEMFEGHMKSQNKISEVNDGLKELGKDFDSVFIDLYSEFTVEGEKLNPDLTNDGLHLTGPGYVKWKSLIDDVVN